MICLVRIAGSVMFVWCNGLYHVCLVYCFDCCSVLSYSHYAMYGSLSCLSGVPLVSARGRTHIDGPFRVCLVYRVRLSWSYSIVWRTMCLFGVPFTSVVVILDCVVYHGFVWCTVYVCRGHSRLCGCTMFVWCSVYVCRGHTRLCGVPTVPYVCLCTVYVLSWSHLTVVCTICLFVYRLHLTWSHLTMVCTICLSVYRLRSVVVTLDCVVYHMFVWCTVYVLSWSHSIVWCTIYLFVYRLRSVMVTLDCVVYHMFV